MKYTIKMSCVHGEVKNITGPNKERERFIVFCELEGLCEDEEDDPNSVR